MTHKTFWGFNTWCWQKPKRERLRSLQKVRKWTLPLPKPQSQQEPMTSGQIKSRTYVPSFYSSVPSWKCGQQWTLPEPGTRLGEYRCRESVVKDLLPNTRARTVLHEYFLPIYRFQLRKEKESWLWCKSNPKEIQFPLIVRLRFCIINESWLSWAKLSCWDVLPS